MIGSPLSVLARQARITFAAILLGRGWSTGNVEAYFDEAFAEADWSSVEDRLAPAAA